MNIVAPANSQPAAAGPSRPKIGLVLEGGGALGLAHIGVLEWLEANRIPVDYLAGTSMGGLVAGLYASGQSTSEIRELIRSINWPATLRGDVPFRDLAYRRKEDRLAFPNRMEFGIRDGLSIPDAINSGHQIGLILDRASLGYAGMKSFNDLPIPFRCVAVEMNKGEQVVFDKGDLGLALRSTMSIPGLFSPSAFDGKVFTDGATLNNLPVDVAKQMGADIVIAVFLKPKPMEAKDLHSLGGVLGRTVSIVITANELRNIQSADVLITVDLAKYTSFDYSKAMEIADQGMKDAEARKGILAKFALADTEYQQHLKVRQARIKRVSPRPEFVEVDGASRPDLEKSIEQVLQPHLKKPLDLGEFEHALTNVVGFGRFGHVGYQPVYRNGIEGVRVRAAEKSYGPPFFNLGINVDGVDTDDVRFDITGRLTFLDLGAYRRELRNDFQFGGRYGVRTEYYVPLSATSNWFVAPSASAGTQPLRLYDGSNQIATYGLTHRTVGADIGYAFNRFAEFRVGHSIGWFSAKRRIGDSVLPDLAERRSTSRVAFRYEGLDDSVVARRGVRVYADLDYYSNLESGIPNYAVGRLRGEYYQPATRKGSWFLAADAGTAFRASQIFFPPFLLGGPRMFGAYGQNELLAQDMIYGTAGWIQELFQLSPLVGDRAFLASFYQVGNVKWFGESRNPQSATAALVLKTSLGPVFFGASFGDASHRRWYFGVGRLF